MVAQLIKFPSYLTTTLNGVPWQRPSRVGEVPDEGLDGCEAHEVVVRPLDLRQPREDLQHPSDLRILLLALVGVGSRLSRLPEFQFSKHHIVGSS